MNCDKWTWSCNQDDSKIWNMPTTPKMSLYPLINPFLPFPTQCQKSLIYFLFLGFLPLPECYINGIMKCVIVWAWLLPLSLLHLRFVHVGRWIRSRSFSLLASIPSSNMHHDLFAHQLVDIWAVPSFQVHACFFKMHTKPWTPSTENLHTYVWCLPPFMVSQPLVGVFFLISFSYIFVLSDLSPHSFDSHHSLALPPTKIHIPIIELTLEEIF